MSNTLRYRGYTALCELDFETDTIFGRVLDIVDTLTFEATTLDGARAQFQRTVDEYLAICAEEGREPARPYSGQIYVRATPAVHRQVALAAARAGMSLNAWAAQALAAAVPEAIRRAALDGQRSQEALIAEAGFTD